MATVNLGRIKPVFRGAYSNSTAYVVDDIVTHGNESFICIQAHGAGTQATSQTAYWTKLAAKGTDGTDVGTTITTQGDLLYRDGSGLQRLAAGTSGQVLQTGGSGANPSWTTMSSDVVKLTSGSITSSTSELVMDNLFSTTYRAYKFIFTDFTPATMNARISYQYRIGTTNQSGNDYYEGGLLYYYNGSESLTSGKEKAASNGRIGRWGTSNTALNASQFEITMSDPKSTRSVKQMFVLNSNPFETDQYYSFQAGFSQWRSSSAVDGIRWYCSTGNIAYLNYAVYGFKH